MSKKAQGNFQIRAKPLHGKKINIFQIFDLNLLKNIFTFNGQSFFTLIAFQKVQEHSKMWKNEQDTLFRSWGILDNCTKGHFGQNAKFSKWAYNLLIQTCS